MNAVMELMEEEEILDENINEFLKEDLALARRPLGEVATLRASQVKRLIVDYLQCNNFKNNDFTSSNFTYYLLHL